MKSKQNKEKKLKTKMESEEFPQTQPLKKILLENRQFEVISNTKEKAVFNEDPNTKIEKPNKAITPYIAFVKDYKENHGTVSFKELGSIWKEISIEEKQKYVKIAEEDLNRYKQENAKYVLLKKKIVNFDLFH